jgi:DNA polymerase III delta prime subunit
MRQMVLELNASDDRGIDVVREQIKTFASTKQIFSLGGASARAGAGFKLIVLDEADAMTSTAQMALRRIMEKYTVNTRFCIIANYAHKLSPALLSRCTRFRFSPLKEADIRVLVDKVVEEEHVKIGGEAVDALVKLSKGDMRRALNVLQACHASSEYHHVVLFLQLLTRGQVLRCDQRMLPRSPIVRLSGTTSRQKRSTTVSQRHLQTPSRRFYRRCSTHQM